MQVNNTPKSRRWSGYLSQLSIGFCHDQHLGDWRYVIRDCSRGTTISFIQHMYDKDQVKKRGAMSQYRAQFGLLYNKDRKSVV